MRALFVAAVIAALSSGNAHAQAMPLKIGARVEGALSARDPAMTEIGHFKVYRFDAQEGQQLRFMVEGSGVSPIVKVAREIGGLTDYMVAAGDGDLERVLLRFKASANGAYMLVIFSGDEDETGGYTLTSADVTNAPPPAPRPIKPGQPIEAELNENSGFDDEQEQSFDYYAFDARAGDHLVITMKSEAFDAYLEVGWLDGGKFEAAAANDDAMGGTDARVRFAVPRDGTFVIRAAALTGIGPYTLQLTSPAPPSPPRRITLDEEIAAELGERAVYDAESDRTFDTWLLRAQQGQKLTIRMRSDDFDAYLTIGTLADGRFTEIEANDDVGSGTNSRIDFTAPRTGEYAIRAAALGDMYGHYVLTVVAARELSLVMPIRRDSMITGEIDDDAEYDEDDSVSYRFYTFRAEAGEQLEIVMLSDDLDAYLSVGRLNGSSFDEMETDDDGFGGTDARIRFIPDRAGEYAIRAGSLGGAHGTFRLRVGRPGAVRRRER